MDVCDENGTARQETVVAGHVGDLYALPAKRSTE
jgi:hypothetical protein